MQICWAALKMTKDTPGHWPNQFHGYCANTTYPEYYYNQEHTVNICSEETVRSWWREPSERKLFLSPTTPCLCQVQIQEAAERGPRRILPKMYLSSVCWRTIALKAKPVAIENSALLPQRQEPHFCLKHAHFGAHPEYMWCQNRLEFTWMEPVIIPEGQGTGTRWTGSTWVLLDVRRGCAGLRGRSPRQGWPNSSWPESFQSCD